MRKVRDVQNERVGVEREKEKERKELDRERKGIAAPRSNSTLNYKYKKDNRR